MNWSIDLNEILLTVLTAVVIPSLIAGAKYLVTYLAAKTTNTKAQHAMQLLGDAVNAAVAQTSQTFVDELKKSGKFTPAAAAQAFDMAKDTAVAMLSDSTKTILRQSSGDLTTLLSAKIEEAVKNQ